MTLPTTDAAVATRVLLLEALAVSERAPARTVFVARRLLREYRAAVRLGSGPVAAFRWAWSAARVIEEAV